MFHADGWTDINEANSLFCNFAGAPKNHSGKTFVTFSLSPHIQVLNYSGSISNGKCKKKKLPVVGTQRTRKHRNLKRDKISGFYTLLTIISGLLTMFGNTSH